MHALITKAIFFALLLAAFTTPAFSEPRKKVVFFNPAIIKSPFFSKATRIMQTAADNLALDLEIIQGNDDSIDFGNQADALFSRSELPDYLILVNQRVLVGPIMARADKLGIKTLLFNGGFSPQTFEALRHGPRALKHWIGQVLPDDQQSGRLLAQKLIDKARAAKSFDNKGFINVIGISGALASNASEQRILGLQSYVDEQDDVLLRQVVHADWNRQESRAKAAALLRRHKKVSVIWTAGDHLALGAADAITLNGLRPGVDVFTAGVDWHPDTFEPIRAGVLSGSVGGHVFDGAWALMLIHEHVQNNSPAFVDTRTQFYWADRHNLSTVEQMLAPSHWQQFDYAAQSKSLAPNSSAYFGAALMLPSED